MRYRSEIDGLRAVAVLSVILFHAGFTTFGGGFVGVDIFFVISGYLITSIIVADREESKFSILRFYERRARRILPALFLVILCWVPFAFALMLPSQLADFGRSVVAVTLFASNFLFWKENGYFAPDAAEKPLLHTWTLAVEEQYYLIFPLFIMLFWPLGKRWLVGLIALTAVASLSLAELGWRYFPHANFFLAPTRAWELLIGATCAFYLREENSHKRNEWLAATGLGLIATAVLLFDEKTPFPSLYGLMPAVGSAFVILFAEGTVVGRILSARAMVGIGLISYSAYLWHQPLLAFARMTDNLTRPVAIVLMALSLILAWASWRYIELPFRDRQKMRLRYFIPIVALGIAFVNTAAITAIASHGLVGRYAPEDRALASLDVLRQGDYVRTRSEALRLAPFSDGNRTKMLVIGDSYSQDLVNALFESGIGPDIQISTFAIQANCGNLFLKEDFSRQIEEADLPMCKKHGWYENPKFRERIAQADVIWLASAWRPWQVERLPRSIANLKAITKAKILVLGNKAFGSFRVRDLLSVTPQQRRFLQYPLNPSDVKVSRDLRRSIDKTEFVDAEKLICADTTKCRLFTENGDLISYDGHHLTAAGAKFFGEKLVQDPIVVTALHLKH